MNKKIQIAIDIGYANTKVFTKNVREHFPSIVGTPDTASFTLVDNSGSGMTLRIGDKRFNVGDLAVKQSQFSSISDDRSWYDSEMYQVLLHAALATAIKEDSKDIFDVTVATGLPIAFYEDDKEKIRARFEGRHTIQIDGREHPLLVDVESCKVIPQGMGTLFDKALSDNGTVGDEEVFVGNIGVIDIGGKTTNILHAEKMGDVSRETTSVERGAWDAVKSLRSSVEKMYPLKLQEHELSRMLVSKTIRYQGEDVDISDLVEPVIEEMGRDIVAKAKSIWPGDGGRLDRIFLGGGGAQIFEEYIKANINHRNIEIVEDSLFSNASGYYKLLLYMDNN